MLFVLAKTMTECVQNAYASFAALTSGKYPLSYPPRLAETRTCVPSDILGTCPRVLEATPQPV